MSKKNKSKNQPEYRTKLRVLNSRSEGQFNPTNWIKEGNHLFASAKAARATWVVKRRKLKRSLSAVGKWTHGTGMWAELEGLPKASVLLLGYSAEMFLKAGLAKAYQGCSEGMFDRDVRQFSHNFKQLAKEVAFEVTSQDRKDLGTLQKMVLFDARYPVKPSENASSNEQQAARMQIVWSKSEFTRMRHLVLRIRTHVSKIDMDSKNPATVASIKIDDDGYVVYRVGGHLPPRITYKFSSIQRELGRDSLEALRVSAQSGEFLLLEHIWDEASFHEDI